MNINDYGTVPNTDSLPGIPARVTAVHKERYEIVCEYTNQYMLKLLLGNNPDHNKKLQINIISTLSRTDKILSVLNSPIPNNTSFVS